MYQTQTFKIPELKGISKKAVEEHLKLYVGYVKFTNTIIEKMRDYRQDSEKNAYVLGELQRRFSFEFNGMRNHEYYFRSLEGGTQTLSEESSFRKAIVKDFGSFDTWFETFTALALTRGIGWAMLYYDPQTDRLTHAWIDEHHIGQLNGLRLVLGLDMWEHAFMIDYSPADKKKYVTAFFENLNWSVIEKNYLDARGWRM
jgi:superoxide dismutase, Fe-Mn family